MSILMVDFTPIFETFINFMVGVKNLLLSFQFSLFGVTFDFWHWIYLMAFFLIFAKIIHSLFTIFNDVDSVVAGQTHLHDDEYEPQHVYHPKHSDHIASTSRHSKKW